LFSFCLRIDWYWLLCTEMYIRELSLPAQTATKVPGVAKARECVHNDLSYILCPQGVRPGDILTASRDTALPLDPGNAMPIMFMPPGTVVHNSMP
jgi:hypothetical protein